MNQNELVAYTTILAILLSPVIAIGVGRYLQGRKEKIDRRYWLFSTLLANQNNAQMPQEWLQALNLIELEFHDNTSVLEHRRQWYDHINVDTYKMTDVELKKWIEKKDELYVDMLSVIGNELGFSLPESKIGKTYNPSGISQNIANQLKLTEATTRELSLHKKSKGLLSISAAS